MAGSGSVQFVISGSGLQQAWRQNVNVSMPLTNPVGEVVLVNLTTTPTAQPVPSGATFVLIVPPAGNTVQILVGGVGVALGAMLALSPANPSCFALSTAPPPSVLMACASGTVTGVAIGFY